MIAVSEPTRADLLHYYHVPAERVSVAAPARFDHIFDHLRVVRVQYHAGANHFDD